MAELHDEVWKDIIGFEGLYQVSNMGRVKTLARQVGTTLERDRVKHASMTAWKK